MNDEMAANEFERVVEGLEDDLGRRREPGDDSELIVRCKENEVLGPLFARATTPADHYLVLAGLCEAAMRLARKELIRMQHRCAQQFGIEP